MLNQMSWNGGALNVSKCVCNYNRTLLSIHRLRGCPNAAKQQLVNATGRKWSIAWRLPGSKKGASLPQHPISTSFSFTLLDFIEPYPCHIKFPPSVPSTANDTSTDSTPTQAQASVPEVAPGELQVDLDEISESENRCLLREKVFFRWDYEGHTNWCTLYTNWNMANFHQRVYMFEGYELDRHFKS